MKKNRKLRKYAASILTRLLVPMIFVFVIQAAVVILMFLNSDILKKSRDNAYGILSEKVLNRKIIIENEMVNRWSRIEDLHKKGVFVYSVEQVEHSTKLHTLNLNAESTTNNSHYAIIMGNEVKGVKQSVVDMSDACLEIPQFGTKHSLNVSVTAGIVIWEFAKQLFTK